MHYPLNKLGSFRFLDRDMLMRHFGGGIGHLSHVLSQDSESSSDSDSAMDTDSESNLHSAALEGGFENNSGSDSVSVSSTSSESSLDDDSQESDLDSGDNGYDSL